MWVHPLCRGAILGFFVYLLFAASFCRGDEKTIEVVGVGECADCKENNIKTSQAVSGLSVTIDCKLQNGEIKRVGVGELDKEGKFKVSLPEEIVQEGKLKEECYAQLHSASAAPCPAHNGLEDSKVVLKSITNGKHTFSPNRNLKFSTALCTSAFLWPFFKYPPSPKIHPWKKHFPKVYFPPLKNFGHPWPLPPFPPVYTKPLPPPVPIYMPKPHPHPVPIYKPKPHPHPVPIYKPKPHPHPVPIYKPKPLPHPVPIYKPKPPVKPLPPPIPIYKPKPKPPIYKPPVVKPLPPPVPIYKPKPKPPVYKPPMVKPLPPPVPIYKPKPTVPIYKPKPAGYKPPMVKPLPPPVTIYKPKPKPPIYKPPVVKPLPPPVPLYKPKPPIYIPPIVKPLPPPIPIYKPLPPFYKKPCPPLLKHPPFHHPKFGYFPPLPPFIPQP
ncbi:proline-rich protein 4-like isoform X3 [Olea europaea var. sylvestris]|uniref:proline-rich protein 4-like isoform X3 n=1 Tax=Olea europaea var. sylvestris TaxID=158386 RepID=UPI000C1D3E49|nr:proline-rich protein 4-like isoform X3 [Olea europaea var. sylvestris]